MRMTVAGCGLPSTGVCGDVLEEGDSKLSSPALLIGRALPSTDCLPPRSCHQDVEYVEAWEFGGYFLPCAFIYLLMCMSGSG